MKVVWRASTRTPSEPVAAPSPAPHKGVPLASSSERPRRQAGSGDTSPPTQVEATPAELQHWGVVGGDAGQGELARCHPGRASPAGHSGARAESRVQGEPGDSAGPRWDQTRGLGAAARETGRGPRSAEFEAQTRTTHLERKEEAARIALTLEQRRELLNGSPGEAETLEQPFFPSDAGGKSQAPAASRTVLCATPLVVPPFPVPPSRTTSGGSYSLATSLSRPGPVRALQQGVLPPSAPRPRAAEPRRGGRPASFAAWPPPLRRCDVLREVEACGGDVSLPRRPAGGLAHPLPLLAGVCRVSRTQAAPRGPRPVGTADPWWWSPRTAASASNPRVPWCLRKRGKRPRASGGGRLRPWSKGGNLHCGLLGENVVPGGCYFTLATWEDGYKQGEWNANEIDQGCDVTRWRFEDDWLLVNIFLKKNVRGKKKC